MPRRSYSDDFSMYYGNSVITDDQGRVLRVDFTSSDDSIRDPYENIIFHCTRIDSGGDLVENDVRVPYGNAILDLPPLGSFLLRGDRVFARYGNSRTVKKGLNRNRVRIGSGRGTSVGASTFYRLAYLAYNNTGFAGKLSNTAYVHNDRLYYKGQRVGSVRDGQPHMLQGLEYLEVKFQTWMNQE